MIRMVLFLHLNHNNFQAQSLSSHSGLITIAVWELQTYRGFVYDTASAVASVGRYGVSSTPCVNKKCISLVLLYAVDKRVVVF
jgi:hypothetical protein